VKSRKFYRYHNTNVLRIIFPHCLLKYIFALHFDTVCFIFKVTIILQLTRHSKLQYISNAFHLVLNHVHSCLKMVVKTETCSIVECSKPSSLTANCINQYLFTKAQRDEHQKESMFSCMRDDISSSETFRASEADILM
jgi:hypothetical protein